MPGSLNGPVNGTLISIGERSQDFAEVKGFWARGGKPESTRQPGASFKGRDVVLATSAETGGSNSSPPETGPESGIAALKRSVDPTGERADAVARPVGEYYNNLMHLLRQPKVEANSISASQAASAAPVGPYGDSSDKGSDGRIGFQGGWKGLYVNMELRDAIAAKLGFPHMLRMSLPNGGFQSSPSRAVLGRPEGTFHLEKAGKIRVDQTGPGVPEPLGQPISDKLISELKLSDATVEVLEGVSLFAIHNGRRGAEKSGARFSMPEPYKQPKIIGSMDDFVNFPKSDYKKAANKIRKYKEINESAVEKYNYYEKLSNHNKSDHMKNVFENSFQKLLFFINNKLTVAYINNELINDSNSNAEKFKKTVNIIRNNLFPSVEAKINSQTEDKIEGLKESDQRNNVKLYRASKDHKDNINRGYSAKNLLKVRNILNNCEEMPEEAKRIVTDHQKCVKALFESIRCIEDDLDVNNILSLLSATPIHELMNKLPANLGVVRVELERCISTINALRDGVLRDQKSGNLDKIEAFEQAVNVFRFNSWLHADLIVYLNSDDVHNKEATLGIATEIENNHYYFLR